MRRYLKEGQYSIDENDILGKGTFGRVFRAYDHQAEQWRALKAIDMELLQNYGKQMKDIICSEITVMRKFSKQLQQRPCPYLVRHFECFRTDKDVFIVMELCQGGTLSDYIQENTLSQSQVVIILKQIATGLQYLSQMNISHRDLKPQNIYLATGEEGKTIFKIGDFGFAAQKQSFTQVLGTYPFMAPEIFKREQYNSKVDVWSLGIIAYQMLFKELPFFGKNKWEIEKKVLETPFALNQHRRQSTSQAMHIFLGKCLSKDKNARPTAGQLLELPLFAEGGSEVFDALECQLQYCEFLREMAGQICDFGQKQNRHTQFMQIYFLKRAYSICNLLTFSVINKQNHLNLDPSSFASLTNPSFKEQYESINSMIQKEYILVSKLFKDKYAQFTKYIQKFTQEEQQAILKIVAEDQIYKNVSQGVYAGELSKWVGAMGEGWQELRAKCQKLLQL